jgi:delta-aminolevulinic acid dehydratase/porphobilinogen synthase
MVKPALAYLDGLNYTGSIQLPLATYNVTAKTPWSSSAKNGWIDDAGGHGKPHRMKRAGAT